MRVQPSLKLLKKKDSRLKEPRRGVCFLCGDVKGFVTAYGGIKTDAGTFCIEVCRGCGLKRTEPFLDAVEMDRIYSHSSYREDDASRFFYPLEWVIDRLRSRRCAAVESFFARADRPLQGTVLDVGCGRGDFLSRMAARGWKATGLELDRRVVNRARKLGLDMRVGELAGPATAIGAGFPDGQFDAVTFNHVFEHVRDPVGTLRECARILKPGGLLLIAVPNVSSLQARVAGRHWFHLDPPYHLYHYSLKTLKGLLSVARPLRKADAGGGAVFEVESVRYFSIEYNPYGWLQSVYNLCGFPRNLLYDFLRGKAGRAFYTRFCLVLTFMTLPLFAPLSMALSIFEAAAGMGGTIEVYARKKK